MGLHSPLNTVLLVAFCLADYFRFQVSTQMVLPLGGLPWPDMERNIYLICYPLSFFLVLLKIWSCFGCLLIICYSTLEFNLLQGRDLMCLIHSLSSAVPGRQHIFVFPKTFWLHHTIRRILVPLPVIKPCLCSGSSESQWLDHQGGATTGLNNFWLNKQLNLAVNNLAKVIDNLKGPL